MRSLSPEPDAQGVPLDVEIRVEFDRRMRASSLDGGNFYVWDVDADVEVEGRRVYEVETRTAVFLSTDLFEPNRRYRVVVDDDVRSERYGIRLRHTRIWEFTTVVALPVASDTPAARWQLTLLAQCFATQVAAEPSDSNRDLRLDLALAMSRAFVLEHARAADEELALAIARWLVGETPDLAAIDRSTLPATCTGLLQALADQPR